MRIVVLGLLTAFYIRKRTLVHYGNKMSLKQKIFIFHGRMNTKDSSYETKIIKSFSQNGKSQPPFQT